MQYEVRRVTNERELSKVRAFLEQMELTFDEGVDTVFALFDDDKIIGSASREANTLKCIALLREYQGEGLLNKLMSALIQDAFANGLTHLFLFTKPKNKAIFKDFLFYPIVETKEVLLMENKRDGIKNYIKRLQEESLKAEGVRGSIIMHANPFTLGHRYLIESALKECDTLHLFVLSKGKNDIPFEIRYNLVKEGIKDLKRVILHESEDYLISPITFPTYFIKDKDRAESINAALDIKIFATLIAPSLNITKRFVGTEPFSTGTKLYNEELKKALPLYNIELIEIERLKSGDREISATEVRALLEKKEFEKLKALVPPSTYSYVISALCSVLTEKL